MAGALMDEARSCVAVRSDGHPRCVALAEAAAYVQTVAVAAVSCTGPGVFELRARALDHLQAIEDMGDADDAPRPPVATIPSCA